MIIKIICTDGRVGETNCATETKSVQIFDLCLILLRKKICIYLSNYWIINTWKKIVTINIYTQTVYVKQELTMQEIVYIYKKK